MKTRKILYFTFAFVVVALGLFLLMPKSTEQQPLEDNPLQNEESGVINGHQWVDLGLSVKWATCNVGAEKQSDYGSYFAWGEVSPKDEYTWSTYKYYRLSGYSNSFSKYVLDGKYGNVDNKRLLDLSDDAARFNWGGSWRMPTFAESEELLNKCTWQWISMDGHNGYLITGPSGKSIFLPASGSCIRSERHRVDSVCAYWTSKLYALSSWAYHLSLKKESYLSDPREIEISDRFWGRSVRPVTE